MADLDPVGDHRAACPTSGHLADTTCISPITRAGEPHPPQAVQQTMPTTANVVATRSSPGPPLLIVFAIEVGGRWGSKALQVTRALAQYAWLTRLSAIAVAAQRALATTLDSQLPADGASIGGDIPELPDLLADDRWQTPAGPCRLIWAGGLDHGHLREKRSGPGRKKTVVLGVGVGTRFVSMSLILQKLKTDLP